jgi:putative DNA primase/helicase
MEQKFPCRYRLPVKFLREVEAPKRWLSFLNDLLEYDDIMTLQEYMGYCLIPSTKAQKMLIITGRGGEGKSRIGVVMRALLGETMNTGSLAKVETNAFARADLQHLLCMVDDDLKLEALPSTNHIKSIITAETPMDLEKKGMQSYQGRLYVRFMAFGNGTLQSLYDRSHGFFRRQIILSAKPRPTDRVDDPYLSEKLLEEIDGIFAWCLFGLIRLMENDFRFTVSAQAEENMEESKAEGNNIVEFMKSSGFFLYSTAGTITSRKFYYLYTQWCDDNAAKPLSSNSFCTYLRQEADFYGLRYTKHIDIGEGRQARGFTGILALQ